MRPRSAIWMPRCSAHACPDHQTEVPPMTALVVAVGLLSAASEHEQSEGAGRSTAEQALLNEILADADTGPDTLPTWKEKPGAASQCSAGLTCYPTAAR